jgi:hypothetical protein
LLFYIFLSHGNEKKLKKIKKNEKRGVGCKKGACSCIVGGNRRTLRKQHTCCKSLTN